MNSSKKSTGIQKPQQEGDATKSKNVLTFLKAKQAMKAKSFKRIDDTNSEWVNVDSYDFSCRSDTERGVDDFLAKWITGRTIKIRSNANGRRLREARRRSLNSVVSGHDSTRRLRSTRRLPKLPCAESMDFASPLSHTQRTRRNLSLQQRRSMQLRQYSTDANPTFSNDDENSPRSLLDTANYSERYRHRRGTISPKIDHQINCRRSF